jgi:hypothetical protein
MKRMIDKNILLVFGVENLSHFDYSAISSFFVVNLELENEYLIETGS